ncbi:hypothetical protein MRX96_050157 [Rhipicephalus microplus]
MLIRYFGYEELKLLKERVIREHAKWQQQCAQEKCHVELENVDQKADSDEDDSEELPSWADMPQEILLDIFSRLNARDLSICGGVCKSWYNISREPALWKELRPVHWALGLWDHVPLWPDSYNESKEGKRAR